MQEYKRLLHRKKIIDEKLNNRKKDLLCPICNSENRDISKEVFDNHDIYFDSSLDFEGVKISYFTSKEKSKKIIDYLKSNNEGTTKTRLSEVLRMHPNTISKYLDSLLKYQIINKEKMSNKTLYFLN